MGSHRSTARAAGRALSVAVMLILAACAAGGPSSPPPSGPASGSRSSSSGSPACDLITPELAAKVDPDLGQMGAAGKPPGSRAYGCSYMTKTQKGFGVLSVELISPASPTDIGETKKTPDCSPVTGLGDFACFQWTGWFRSEPGGASANTILKAARGSESLDLRYLAAPPGMSGAPVPDGNATARALAQVLADAGWANGSPLGIPSAPPVGPQTTTNNPVCALASPDAVKQAFGATTQPQVLPGESNCRYTFGALGTPGPDSLIFSIEFHPGGASLLSRRPPDAQALEGVGDKADLIIRSEPTGPKSLRPAGDVPTTILSLMVARGQNMAIFTAQILISLAGPTTDQTKDQLITLVKGIDF